MREKKYRIEERKCTKNREMYGKIKCKDLWRLAGIRDVSSDKPLVFVEARVR